MVEGEGFEPSKAEPTDLQSAPLAAREPLSLNEYLIRRMVPTIGIELMTY